jgi:hypothetical protein
MSPIEGDGSCYEFQMGNYEREREGWAMCLCLFRVNVQCLSLRLRKT